MSLKYGYFALAFLISFHVLANDCHLQGDIVVDAAKTFDCPGLQPMVIDSGTRITTNGHDVAFHSQHIEFSGDGLLIRSGDPSTAGLDAGHVEIQAEVCTGKLVVVNDGMPPRGAGGDIVVDCLGYKNFHPSLLSAGVGGSRDGRVVTYADGQKVPLAEFLSSL